MSKPMNFAGFTLYRIYYGDSLVYLGRTMQPLQNRIRGHIFKKPMHRVIHIGQVSKIEYATFQSEADMFLYEIYFINKWKPPLNVDDKAADDLSISLPEVEWKVFTTPLWEKWKKEIEKKDEEEKRLSSMRNAALQKHAELRRKKRAGEITEKEFWKLEMEEVQPFL